MTISYQDSFMKLMLRWKGSLWKTIWRNLFIFMFLYYTINMLYRFVMPPELQGKFRVVIASFNAYTAHYPLTFMLGFYVAMVIQRWWTQFYLLSWPDEFLHAVSVSIRCDENNGKLYRKTIARYTLLTSLLGWESISERVLARCPGDENLLKTKLINKQELEMYIKIRDASKMDPHKMWFVPLNWIQTLLIHLYEHRMLYRSDFIALLKKMASFRNGFSAQFLFAWVPISLAYTQLAVIAVYGYFAFCLIARQYPTFNKSGEVVDVFFPGFTFLQFLFYVGWLKVGEDLLFPFGSDDEDFEMTYLLERNMEMSYLLVDDLYLHGRDKLKSASFGPAKYESTNSAYTSPSSPSSVSAYSEDETMSSYREEFEVRLPHTVASMDIEEHPPHSNVDIEDIDPQQFAVTDQVPIQDKCRPGVVLHSCLSAICATFIGSVTVLAVYVYFAYK